jgi:two-component system NarL family sensor kinase
LTERVSLRERLLAERDERRRIAELVHDGPVQHVSALTQMLDAATQALDVGDAAGARRITARALEVARDAAAELREIVAGLEPAMLHELGFASAVRELAERVAGRRGVELTLDLDEGVMLGEGARSGLYQVVREALDQAVRRGPPTHVAIALAVTSAGGASVTIVDDGAPERRQAVVDGLAERARDLNGRLETSFDGRWTTTRVVLPPSATVL